MTKILDWMDALVRKYNPEYDVPTGPLVTFADRQMIEAIRELHKDVEDLKERVARIESGRQPADEGSK